MELQTATSRDMLVDYMQYELKTNNNSLSLWKVNNGRDVDDAFVALVTSAQSIGSMCAVKIDEGLLQGFSFDGKEGNSPTFGINDKHCNIENLTYGKLGDFIDAVLQSLKSDGMVRKTKSEMKQILKKAWENNQLDLSKMNEHIASSIQKTCNGDNS